MIEALRLGLVVLGVSLWFLTQKLLSSRPLPTGNIVDRLHLWSQPVHDYLLARPRVSNALLIATSALIDVVGLFLMLWSIFGPTVRPFLGLLILFALRQLNQALISLPSPEKMIWNYPGFPSLFVTYGTGNDFFFSGHTAVAVYGAVELCRLDSTLFAVIGVVIAVIEIVAIFALHAHWTMDVFGAIVTALWVGAITPWIAPHVDGLLTTLAGAG